MVQIEQKSGTDVGGSKVQNPIPGSLFGMVKLKYFSARIFLEFLKF